MITHIGNTANDSTISLYKNEIELSFFDNDHRYTVKNKGQEVFGTVGVTTVLSILDKPALVQWSASCAVDRMVEIVDSNKGTIDEVTLEYMKKECAIAWKQKRDSAGDIGTLVHKWIEAYINFKLGKQEEPEVPQNPIIKQATDKFRAWEFAESVEFLTSERMVYSRKHNYAGTCDLTFRKKTPTGYVYGYGDIKTSKYIYDTFPLQLAGYRYADEEEQIYTHGVVKNKAEIMNIIRVGKDDGAVQVVNFGNYQEHATAFLCALFLHRHIKTKKLTK